MASVLVNPDAQEQIARLPKVMRARVFKIIKRLQRWPAVSGVKALSGNLAGHYRLRTGDYRVQFVVRGDAVIVEKVGHRGRFYEG